MAFSPTLGFFRSNSSFQRQKLLRERLPLKALFQLRKKTNVFFNAFIRLLLLGAAHVSWNLHIGSSHILALVWIWSLSLTEHTLHTGRQDAFTWKLCRMQNGTFSGWPPSCPRSPLEPVRRIQAPHQHSLSRHRRPDGHYAQPSHQNSWTGGGATRGLWRTQDQRGRSCEKEKKGGGWRKLCVHSEVLDPGKLDRPRRR